MISRLVVVPQIGNRRGARGGLEMPSWFTGNPFQNLPLNFASTGSSSSTSWWEPLLSGGVNWLFNQVPTTRGRVPTIGSPGPVQTLPKMPFPVPSSFPPQPDFVYQFPRTPVYRADVCGHRKSRRMRFCNEKALRRSLRRIQGFQHLVKRSHVFSATAKSIPGATHRRRRTCKCQ